MTADLLIGIDSSTTATKAIAWTADGRAVAEGREAIPMLTPAPDRYEQDPASWWDSTAGALRAVTRQVDAGAIRAVAIANQRETFAAFNADGTAIRPAIVWLDERARPETRSFSAEVGADRLHRISGKPVDITPVVYRLAWLRDHEAPTLRDAAKLCEVHGYLVWRLTGRPGTSWASADPMGVFDLEHKIYAPDILEPLGLTDEQFAEAHAPGTVLGTVTKAAARATGLAAGTPIVAGAGDGQAAGLGVGALTPESAYLNLGTAVVSGVHGDGYRVDQAYRTMCSATGRGYVYESCLRSGTFLLNWLVGSVFGADPERDPAVFQRLEAEAAAVPVGSDGLFVVPYWSGVMSPYWSNTARGAVVGLSGGHTQAHLYRALMEGIALEQAHATALVERAVGTSVRDYIAIGGGAASDLWCRIVAAASGKRVLRSDTVEATSLGAAMAAAVGIGMAPGFADAAAAMRGRITRTFEPEPDLARRYGALLAIYRDIYPSLADHYDRTDAWRRGDHS